MGIRFALAKATGAVLTWGLRTLVRRPAANTPGKIALYVDPQLIGDLRSRIREGSIAVVGTNGKTTVTNLVADALEADGKSVVCNRTGANLDSGVATSLLQTKGVDWGVFECDELWLAKIMPGLQPTYLVLLNLFRDQLDRCGEIDRIQDSIVGAIAASPRTRLIYNADDPLCAMIAKRAVEDAGASADAVAFGVAESMGLEQNVVADATMCQVCSHMFRYEYRQYGQLGAYECPECGFARPQLDFAAHDVKLTGRGISFEVTDQLAGQPSQFPLSAPLSGSYLVYNLLAVAAVVIMTGCSTSSLQKAIDAFDPKNGRLQEYQIQGRPTLLNLAKNPTGFNQNLRIVEAEHGPKAAAFFINDKEADGHDISWIWDIDFEELVRQPNVVVFAGGSRRNDLQVRLKYAGVDAQLVEGIEEVFAALGGMAQMPKDAPVYAIANYTALPAVHAKLDEMAKESQETPHGATAMDGVQHTHDDRGKALEPHAESDPEPHAEPQPAPEPQAGSVPVSQAAPTTSAASATPVAASPSAAVQPTGDHPLVIVHLLPDLLNLYGDGGNVRILEQRLKWRGIPVEVHRVEYGNAVDLASADLVFLGGAPDREQRLASEQLFVMKDQLAQFVEEGGVLLGICGGYQILGRTWLLGEDEVPGLGILDIETRRPGTSADRLVDNVALSSPFAIHPVIGYENHAGRTYLDDTVEPFGSVVSKTGVGNAESAHPHADGAVKGTVFGTYLHGPLLAKNPEIADMLLTRALERWATRATQDAVPEKGASSAGEVAALQALDDTVELAANDFMAKRLAVH